MFSNRTLYVPLTGAVKVTCEERNSKQATALTLSSSPHESSPVGA